MFGQVQITLALVNIRVSWIFGAEKTLYPDILLQNNNFFIVYAFVPSQQSDTVTILSQIIFSQTF